MICVNFFRDVRHRTLFHRWTTFNGQTIVMKTYLQLAVTALLLLVSCGTQGQIKKLIEKKANEVLNKPAEKPKAEPKAQPQAEKPAKDTAVKPTDSGTQPALEVYSKYDFIPGEKVIFFEDFGETAQGDFPPGWNTNGSAEVVTTSLFPGKWLKPAVDGRASVFTDQAISLPENYTIEFDVVPQERQDKSPNYTFRLISSANLKNWDAGSSPGKAGIALSFEYNHYFTAYYADGRNRLSNMREGLTQKKGQKYRIAIWVQKERMRMYQDEVKVFDLPKAMDLTVKYNRIRFDNGSPLVTNIRIATGLPDTRNKLLTEGKLVSYGIYFDVNKDVVKPESYATLKSIAEVMKENPDIKVRIVGHTDSDGADAANLDLSKRRAMAVKQELVKSFGIDAARLDTDGKGEAQPVERNDNATNKALNRRVEFIRM
jgi:outer membrane protein OmpA-like peptidoglycan-associated protein